MRRRLFVLLATLVFSGCVCKSGPYVASDTATGAYAKVGDEGREVRESRPTAKVPVSNPELNGRWGPGSHALTRVNWDAPFLDRGRPAAGFQLSADGEVTAQFGADTPGAEIRGWFHRFVTNVTSAETAQRDAWADQFVSNARASAWELDKGGNKGRAVGYHHSLTLDGPFRLGALLQDWKTGDGWYESHHRAGTLTVLAEHDRSWSIELALATRITQLRVDGYLVEATADVGDRVRIMVDHDGELERTERPGLLRTVYAELGWGIPSSEASLYGENEDDLC